MTNVVTMQDIKETMTAKKEKLEAIYALTTRQDQLIQDLDVEGLMDNLNARQRHIDTVDNLEKSLPDRRTLLMNHECAQLAVEINAVVEKILKLDALNQQKARDCLAFLKGQTQKASQGRRVAEYDTGPPADADGIFFNFTY